MKARDLMVRTVASVRTGDTLARAATLMREHDCGAVVVLEPRAVVAAMLTDRDICMAALRSGKPLGDLRVEHSMSRELYTCGPEDDIAKVEDVMGLHQVRRLPVVDADRRLLGLVSLDDIAKAARQQAGLIAPAVPPAGVGRTLGDIVRPHLAGIGTGTEPAAPRRPSA